MTCLPRPAFFNMAEAMPLVVVEGTVHCLLGLAAAREDCFSAGGLRLRLCPLQALEELEQDYWRTSYAQLDAFKVNYLRQVKGEELGNAQQTQRDVLTFLVCEMIPYLRSLQAGDHPAVVEKTGASMPVPQLGDPTPCRLLQDWVGPAALILDQYLYRLTEQTEAASPDALWVRVGRCKYVPERATAQTLAQLEEGYLTAVQSYLQQQAQGEVEERRKAQCERTGSTHEVLAYLSQHAISSIKTVRCMTMVTLPSCAGNTSGTSASIWPSMWWKTLTAACIVLMPRVWGCRWEHSRASSPACRMSLLHATWWC